MKRRQFIKTIPVIAAVPLVAHEVFKAVGTGPEMTATEVLASQKGFANELDARFVRLYEKNVRKYFAQNRSLLRGTVG